MALVRDAPRNREADNSLVGQGPLAPDGGTVNIKMEPEQQAALVESRPDAFHVIEGGWGRQGWTTMTLAAVSVAEAKAVLTDAHAGASVDLRKAPKSKSKRAAKRKR